MKLARLLALGRSVRVLGLDDGPFHKSPGAAVPLCGVLCRDTRFEGMLWGSVRRDGFNATREVLRLVGGSKFLPQLHLVLLDGLAFGGFNLVDLPALADGLGVPCVAVCRRMPDLRAMTRALGQRTQPSRRLRLLQRAGPLYEHPPWVFQVAGEEPAVIARALARVTDTGHVPECLRLAHLVAAAVRLGESNRRA